MRRHDLPSDQIAVAPGGGPQPCIGCWRIRQRLRERQAVPRRERDHLVPLDRRYGSGVSGADNEIGQ